MSNDLKREILYRVSKGELTPRQALSQIKGITPKSAYREKDIAIVGVDAKLPGAKSLDEFWKNLKEGVDSITTIPSDRWDMENFYCPEPENCNNEKSYSKHGGFLTNVYNFDPHFFSLSPKEATLMDPQERLLLQSAWHLFEDAGISREKISKHYSKMGVYIGETTNSYLLWGPQQWERENKVLPTTFPWSMANRISYFFNTNGPSITIDTACSSSLVALHQAVQALRNGDIPLALVGGVNLYLHPSKYIWLSSMRMISPTGRSSSFGSDADGFCPGEGVATILLKPANQAIKDGDKIWGIIKGTAINHDGKTTGYTVPNPQAQSQLILDALDDAGCVPNDISLIEAHGTGTKLGDPIEISGIKKVFSQCSTEHTCSISSVKSNIGHLESAAGLAGLVKVLLQMKHRKKVPSLHSTPINPEINLSDTPLSIQQECSPWLTDNNRLVAGICSFGAGGVNAHAVIEAYSKTYPSIQKKSGELQLFVLSAQSKEALLHLIKSYNELIGEKKPLLINLCAQCSLERSQLKLRFALKVKSLNELSTLLHFYSNNQELERYLSSNASIPQSSHPTNENRESLLQYYHDAWRRGETIQWEELYTNAISTIKLPAYPFADKEYRIKIKQKEVSNIIHPLLGRNSSTFNRISFTTKFTGKEFFLSDHIVNDEKVLPGTAYLEMALQAIKEVTGKWYNHFNRVFWTTPYIFNTASKEIVVSLKNLQNKIQFKITSDHGKIEHASGFCALKENVISEPSISAILSQEKFTKETIYSQFKVNNLNYGDTFKPITSITFTHDKALSILNTPESLLLSYKEYRLHPNILDGVLQTTIPFTFNNGTMLPFSIDELTINTPLKDTIHVETEKISESETAQQFNLSSYDDTGSTLVSIKGLTLKKLNAKSSNDKNLSYLVPQWYPSEIPQSSNNIEEFWFTTPYIITDSNKGNILKDVEQKLTGFTKKSPNLPCSIIVELPITLPEDTFYCWLVDLIQIIQTYCSAPRHLVFYTDTASIYTQMLTGFLRCAILETTNLLATIISFNSLDTNEMKMKVSIEANILCKFRELQYRKHVRFEKKYQSLPQVNNDNITLMGKTILITGGVGGLGKHFTTHLLSELKAERVILLGRSSQDKISDKIVELTKSDNKLLYIQGDISSHKLVEDLIKTYSIDGIIHAAGNHKDTLISQKTHHNPSYLKVLKPKIDGTKQIISASEKYKLDFVIFCSSISSIIGNEGQSDYALANAYMDAIANTNNETKFVSINWPLWESGGMNVKNNKIEYFARHWGMQPLETDIGLEALNFALANEHKQVLPFQGNEKKLQHKLNNTELIKSPKSNKSPQSSMYQEVLTKLLDILANITGYEKEHISEEDSLDELGFDSLMITDLSNRLSKTYSLSLSIALFFEFTSAKEICNHLLAQHGNQLSTFHGITITENEKQINETPKIDHTPPKDLDIAIIGMNGIFPKCNNVNEYWDLIKSGKSAISEVPQWRWDKKPYIEKGVPPYGGFIDNIECFDPHFFGISQQEARLMDPQQRICLQVIWKTIEDSGYRPSALSGSKTGLYIGVSVNDYAEQMEKESISVQAHTSIGSVHSMLVNRISYFLNLTGPSEPIDTACSSSLVALHRAVQDIQNGNAEMAIVGGVNTLLSPKLFESFHKAGMLSPDGLCRTCDAKANGYVRSEGAGAILLKPLQKAIDDGDAIYATIKGTGVNHGGKAKSLTAPNPKAQRELLIDTYTKANIPFHTLDYIELHGTGTPLGDPIEVSSILSAYEQTKQSETQNSPCHIGSVKSTIGHLESAAGIAGVINILNMMRHQKIPPLGQFETLNPEINLQNSPYKINSSNNELSLPAIKRAGINSFGFGGVNAHVILENVQNPNNTFISDEEEQIVLFSAKTKQSLMLQLQSFYEYFLKIDNSNLNTNKEHHNQLKEIIASVLEIPANEIDIDLPPSELGIDRIIGQEIVTRLKDKLNIHNPLSDLLKVHRLSELVKTGNNENSNPVHVSLQDIAYTLQMGREQFRYRYACTARSITTVRIKLGKLLEKKSEEITHYISDSDSPITVDYKHQNHYGQSKNEEIIKLWLSGKDIHWENIYKNNSAHPRRVHLPTYGFEKHQIWFDDRFESVKNCNKSVTQNTSILTTLSDFNGLNVSELEGTTELTSIGIDSISILQIADELKTKNKLNISISDLSEIRTIDELLNIENVHIQTGFNPSIENDTTTAYTVNKTYDSSFSAFDIAMIHFATLENAQRIEYLVAGQGIPIFFLNGLGMDFEKIKDLIHTFSKTFKLIVLNYPGIGNSDPSHNFTFEIIESTINSICNTLGINVFHLFGWSMGGFIAQQYTEKNEQKVLSLTLINTASYLDIDFTPQSVNNLLQKVSKSYTFQIIKNNKTVPETERDTLDYKHTIKSLDYISKFNPTKRNFKITVPTLIIAGELDPITPLEYAVEMHAYHSQHIKDCTLLIYDNQEHFIPLFNYDQLLVDFLTFNKDIWFNPHSVNKKYGNLSALIKKENRGKETLNSIIKRELKSLFNDEELYQYSLVNNYKSNAIIEALQYIINNFETGDSLNTDKSEISYSELIKKVPSLGAHIPLIKTSLNNLKDVISDNKSGTEVLFPNGDFSLVKNIYNDNIISHTLNIATTNEVVNTLSKCKKNSRILEIGAGTGSLTRYLLTAIATSDIEYHFTDLSKTFINEAKSNFKNFDFMSFYSLNIEEVQDSNEKFDIIVASNVLHATSNINKTLTNIRSILNPNGIILINELITFDPFTTVTFGLLDGWWLSQDRESRIPHSPLLSEKQWMREFHNAGFNSFKRIFPNDACSLIHSAGIMSASC